MEELPGNRIHPTAIITGDVSLGSGNDIQAYCILTGPIELGDNNIIGPHVVIGGPGQNSRDPRYPCESKRIRIGSNNIIREFGSIHKPCFGEITEIGSNLYFMHSVHISHDALIEDSVVLTSGVTLAGTCTILEGANLGLGTTVHQNTVIGQFSMVAMGSSVVKNVRPFAKYIPGKPLGVNEYAIDKFGFAAEANEIRSYVISGTPPASSRLASMVGKYEYLHAKSGRSEYR